jgi:hypothetical protein
MAASAAGRRRSYEIAAGADKNLGTPLNHRLDGVYDVVSMSSRRFKPKDLF